LRPRSSYIVRAALGLLVVFELVLDSDAWSPQTSQLFLDPLSFILLHGVMFAGVLALLIRNLSASWRL